MKVICPHCQHDWTAYAKENYPRPQPGQWMICLDCLNTCRFGQDMKLVIANEADLPENVLEDVKTFRYLRKNSVVVHRPPQNVH